MLDLDREFPVIPGELLPDNASFELKKHLSQLLGRRTQSFIGSQPVSFTKEHLTNQLINRDYYVCEKSDGLRCLLLNTIDPQQNEVTCLITRENQIYHVPGFHFPLAEDEDKYHVNTLIDGELVLSNRADGNGKELKYLMFDCLILNSVSIISYPLPKRLGKLKEFFYEPYLKFCGSNKTFVTNNNPFKIRMKEMQNSYHLGYVLETAKHQGHISDGLIFTCAETSYIFGTDPTLLKWKPAEENTVDFKMQLHWETYVDPDLDDHHPDKSYLNYDAVPLISLHIWQGDDDYTGESKYERFKSDLTITEEEWNELKSLNQPLDERIIECHKNIKGEWKFLRFRDDKSNGNHKTVVEKVLISIEDGVTKDQLITDSKLIRNAWKERENRRRSNHYENSKKREEQERRKREEYEDRKAREQVERQTHEHQESNDAPHYDNYSSDGEAAAVLNDEINKPKAPVFSSWANNESEEEDIDVQFSDYEDPDDM